MKLFDIFWQDLKNLFRIFSLLWFSSHCGWFDSGQLAFLHHLDTISKQPIWTPLCWLSETLPVTASVLWGTENHGKISYCVVNQELITSDKISGTDQSHTLFGILSLYPLVCWHHVWEGFSLKGKKKNYEQKPLVLLPAVVIFTCFALSLFLNLLPTELSADTFNKLSATVSSKWWEQIQKLYLLVNLRQRLRGAFILYLEGKQNVWLSNTKQDLHNYNIRPCLVLFLFL